MTIAILNINTGEVDIIENCPNLRNNEEVENYLSEVFQYNPDDINYIYSPAIEVNYLTPDDFGTDEDVVDRYRLIAQIHSQHEGYMQNHDAEPRYARVRVQYHDQENGMDVIIKLNDEVDEFDEDIFFNCTGIDDLIRLCYADTEDFDVTEVYELMSEI